MLGFILMYFVGKAFYNMAKKHEQSGWLYAILGVLSYYAGLVLGGVLLGVILGLFYPEFIESSSELFLGLLTIPMGILCCWGFYQILKVKWEKEFAEKERNKPKISDIGKREEDSYPTQNFLPRNTNTEGETLEKNDGFRF